MKVDNPLFSSSNGESTQRRVRHHSMKRRNEVVKMTQFRKRIAAIPLAAALVVGSVAVASPAMALGSSSRACSSTTTVYGWSTGSAANTNKANASDCGSVGIQIGYWAPGGVQAYSPWRYDTTTRTLTSSEFGAIFTGVHGSTAGYASAHYFLT